MALVKTTKISPAKAKSASAPKKARPAPVAEGNARKLSPPGKGKITERVAAATEQLASGIMGYPAGQLPDRFHFLGLAQLVFHRLDPVAGFDQGGASCSRSMISSSASSPPATARTISRLFVKLGG